MEVVERTLSWIWPLFSSYWGTKNTKQLSHSKQPKCSLSVYLFKRIAKVPWKEEIFSGQNEVELQAWDIIMTILALLEGLYQTLETPNPCFSALRRLKGYIYIYCVGYCQISTSSKSPYMKQKSQRAKWKINLLQRRDKD